SLLPMKIRREKMWREKLPWFGAAAAVFVAAPLLGYGSIYMGKNSLDANRQVETQNANTLKMAKSLDAEWDTKVETAGAPDRSRALNYGSLKQGRDTQNTLLADILAQLPPVPPNQVGTDKTKLPPRDQRDIIRVEHIAMDYHDDMTPIETMPDEAFRQLQVVGISVPANAGGTGGMSGSGFQFNQPRFGGGGFNSQPANAAEGAAPTGKTRGFVMEIVCVTPKAAGASFVLDKFVSKLPALVSSNPDVSYKVIKAQVPVSMKLGAESPQTPGGGFNRPPVGAGGFGAGGFSEGRGAPGAGFGRPTFGAPQPGTPAPGTPDQPAAFDPLQDPTTGEDMRDDTRVIVRLAVELDPGKKDQAAAGGGAGASAPAPGPMGGNE
ncbi:MAG TPA: hypothetical protein VLJ39_19875, partial [Tepidisphaeraceae bacterium]|nr:hypothetical protein [Tepidisphaeraceae bacterium]